MKYDYFFKDFRNSAEKYNIENVITSRHQHARCQEWCHSNDNSTWISKMLKQFAEKSLEYEICISNTTIYLRILEILLRNTILKTQKLREISMRGVKSSVNRKTMSHRFLKCQKFGKKVT